MTSGSEIDQEIEDAKYFRGGNIASISWSVNASKPHIPQHFVLQYDTEPEVNSFSDQIVIRDGFFAHFFFPTHIPPFEQHFVFVLEVSGSMDLAVLSQMKEGVAYLLNELDRKDRFSIITFNDSANVFLDDRGHKHVKYTQNFIQSLNGTGGANLHGALLTALNLTSAIQSKKQPSSIKPVIVLFSTGNVTSIGGADRAAVLSEIAAANEVQNVPIYSLAYGPSSDLGLLRKISIQNNGFARKVFPDSDHDLQMTQFYTEISSLLLVDLDFTYDTSNTTFKVGDVTRTSFPSYFKQSSIVVVGKLEALPTNMERNNESEWPECHEQRMNATLGLQAEPGMFSATVHGRSKGGWREFTSSKPLDCNCLQKTSSNFMNRLWSYLKVKEALQEADAMTEEQLNEIRKAGCDGPAEYAQRLALKYGFVTPVTSLVVVQPNNSNIVVESQEDNVLSVKAAVRTGPGGPQQNRPRGNIRCRMIQPKHRFQPGHNKMNEAGVARNSTSVPLDAFRSSGLNGTSLHSSSRGPRFRLI